MTVLHPVIQLLLFVGTVIFGSLNTASRKILFQSCGVGLDYCTGDRENCNVNESSTAHLFNKVLRICIIIFMI
jgi:hypothetical protein